MRTLPAPVVLAGKALIPFSCIASIWSAAESWVAAAAGAPVIVSCAPIVPPLAPPALPAAWAGAALDSVLHAATPVATPAMTAAIPASRRKRRRVVGAGSARDRSDTAKLQAFGCGLKIGWL